MKTGNHPKWYAVLKAVEAGQIESFDYISFRFLVGAVQEPVGSPFKSRDEARAFSECLYEELKHAHIDGDIVASHDCSKVQGPVVYVQQLPPSDHRIPFSFDQMWSRYGEEIVAADYRISDRAKQQIADVLSNYEGTRCCG